MGKKHEKILIYSLVAIACVIFVFPVYWMIVTSFKIDSELVKYPPEWIPGIITLKNFQNILSDTKFLNFYKNTLIVASSTTLLCMFLAIMASYSFSRFKFFGSKSIQMMFLSTQMFPAVVLVITLYIIYNKLRLLNSYFALILACATTALPLSIWVLKGFYNTIPRSLEEAAYIDGCSRFRTLAQIILPLIKAGTCCYCNLFISSFMG